MRIMGFATHWAKLDQGDFTTFRYERGDRDWNVNEVVQVRVGGRRRGGGERLGCARILAKERKYTVDDISEAEAIEDGFLNKDAMLAWLAKAHRGGRFHKPLYKYNARWTRNGEELPLVFDHESQNK